MHVPSAFVVSPDAADQHLVLPSFARSMLKAA
jgi:hypothetical protein